MKEREGDRETERQRERDIEREKETKGMREKRKKNHLKIDLPPFLGSPSKLAAKDNVSFPPRTCQSPLQKQRKTKVRI